MSWSVWNFSGSKRFNFPFSKEANGGALWKKAFLKISQNLQENTCASVVFNKIAGLRSELLLKKRLWHRSFPVNFVKFLRRPFSQNTTGWLLLRFVMPSDFVTLLQIFIIRLSVRKCFVLIFIAIIINPYSLQYSRPSKSNLI